MGNLLKLAAQLFTSENTYITLSWCYYICLNHQALYNSTCVIMLKGWHVHYESDRPDELLGMGVGYVVISWAVIVHTEREMTSCEMRQIVPTQWQFESGLFD